MTAPELAKPDDYIIPMTPGPVDLDTPGGQELLRRMAVLDAQDPGILVRERAR